MRWGFSPGMELEVGAIPDLPAGWAADQLRGITVRMEFPWRFISVAQPRRQGAFKDLRLPLPSSFFCGFGLGYQSTLLGRGIPSFVQKSGDSRMTRINLKRISG